MSPATNLLLVALLQAGTPQIDAIRLAGPTGVYVETDSRDTAQPAACDWYASARELLQEAGSPPATRPLDCRLIVRLRGVLNQAGANRFAAVTRLLAATTSVPTRVELNSHGGDAVAALRIARLIREQPLYRRADGGITTVIDPSPTAVCYSACLVVFAAGFKRRAEFSSDENDPLPSRLGIHSPAQFDRGRSRYDTAHDNRSIRIVRARLVQYFQSVDVSEQIVADMFAVPFDSIHLLTRSEALRYRLIDARDQEKTSAGQPR